jgi:hypothetical protein
VRWSMWCLSMYAATLTTAIGALLVAMVAGDADGGVPGLHVAPTPPHKLRLADPRALLLPDVAGALKVQGVKAPAQVLNGLYFPTAPRINGEIAYKKDDMGLDHPSELWLTKDPHGFWCVQPTDMKGSSNALMITSHANRAKPEDAIAWQLWEDGGVGWRVHPTVKVVRCNGNICNADFAHGAGRPIPVPVPVPGAPVPVPVPVPAPGPGLGGGPIPTPAPGPRAFDNSPGWTNLGAGYLMTDPTNTTSYKLWATAILGGLGLLMFTCCLLNGDNGVARSYVHNVISRTVLLVIGILIAGQIVPLLSWGIWRTSWVIELVFFLVGYFMLHFLSWKCQYSPIYRTLIWAVGSHLVACFGVAAFLDFRDALMGHGWLHQKGIALSGSLMVFVGAILMALHYLMKWIDKKKFTEPSPTSWPEKPAGVVTQKERSCMTTRACLGGETHDEEVQEEASQDFPWVEDALWAEYTASSIIMAFVIYNFMCAIVDKWGGIHSTGWLIILFVMVIVIDVILQLVKRQEGERWDWQVDMMTVGTVSRVLGLCVAGAMRRMNPGLREQFQEWFGISSVLSSVFVVVLLSYVTLIMVAILSRIFKDYFEEPYGALAVLQNNHYPEEVVGMALMLACAWGVFTTGILGDFVRFIPWLSWNEPWFHALLCILLAGLLYLFWKSFLLPKSEMRVIHHAEVRAQEKETQDKITSLKPRY